MAAKLTFLRGYLAFVIDADAERKRLKTVADRFSHRGDIINLGIEF